MPVTSLRPKDLHARLETVPGLYCGKAICHLFSCKMLRQKQGRSNVRFRTEAEQTSDRGGGVTRRAGGQRGTGTASCRDSTYQRLGRNLDGIPPAPCTLQPHARKSVRTGSGGVIAVTYDGASISARSNKSSRHYQQPAWTRNIELRGLEFIVSTPRRLHRPDINSGATLVSKVCA